MGNLRVDIDTGLGFLNNLGVIGVNMITGATHRGISDPWDKAFINLDPYLGKYVRVRFVGTKNNSAANDRGDMAIDDIKIFQPFSRDINLLESFKELGRPLSGLVLRADRSVLGKLIPLRQQLITNGQVVGRCRLFQSA